MPPSPLELGPTGQTVSQNLRRLCADLGLSLRDLSARMPEHRPLSHSQLSAIQRGVRSVTVDDLTALAVALEVAPITLLMPLPVETAGDTPEADARTEMERPAQLTGTPEVLAVNLLAWLRGDVPLWEVTKTPRDADGKAFAREAFIRRAFPWWMVPRILKPGASE